ncbi:hypothetical protein EC968_008903, partial [Mortierella alpina]
QIKHGAYHSILVGFFRRSASFATACEASEVYKLVNDRGWAKNFPTSRTRPPFISTVLVDKTYASIYELWTVERFEDGYRVRNKGSKYWLTARGNDVDGSPAFRTESSKWYIQPAGNGKYKILTPDADLMVTVGQPRPGDRISLLLQQADGSEDQLWHFEPLDNYS